MRKTIIFGALAALVGFATVAQASNNDRVAASGTPQVAQERANDHGKRDHDRYAERKHKSDKGDKSDLRDHDGDGRRDSHQRYGDRD